MATDLDSLLDEDIFKEEQPQKRPAFLITLCVLSFVGVGLWFIFGIYQLWAARMSASLAGIMTEVNTAINTPEWDAAMRWVRYGETLAIVKLVCTALVLLGAILMWNLRKAGFFIYVAAQLTPIVLYFVLIGGLGLDGFWGFWGWMSYLSDFISIAFIIMYGMNYRYMK
ncbi:MAG: hypothetical protein AB1458_05125 [Bacteroidota bacterium]